MWEIYGNTKDDIWELCRENVDFSHILPTYSLVLHKEWSTVGQLIGRNSGSRT